MKEPLVEGLQDHELLEAIGEGYRLVEADKKVPLDSKALILLERQIIELGKRGKFGEILEKLEQTQHSLEDSASFIHVMRKSEITLAIPRTFYGLFVKSIIELSSAQDVSGLESQILTLQRFSKLRWGNGDHSYVNKIIRLASFEIRKFAPPESFEAIMERIARANRQEKGFVQSLGAMANPTIKRRI